MKHCGKLITLFAALIFLSAMSNQPAKSNLFTPEPMPGALKNALIQMINTNSGTKNPAGIALSQAQMIPLFTNLGFHSRTVEVPPLAGGGGPRTVVVFEMPNAKPDILMLGHIDTVFEPSSPFQTFTEDGLTWKGPGVADMKGNLMMMVHVLSTLKARGEVDLSRLRIAVNDDEELGSPSSGPFLKTLADQAKYGLILEPVTGGSDVTPSHSGVMGIEVLTEGRAVAAGYPTLGVNACLELAEKILTIQKLMKFDRGLFVNTGVIASAPDAKRNMVCAKATAQVDVRFIDTNDLLQFKSDVQQIASVPAVCNRNGSECATTKVQETMFAPAMTADRTVYLLDIYKKTAAAYGHQISALHKGGCDAYGIMDSKLYLLSGLGMHGGGYHSLDEHTVIEAYPRKYLMNLAFLDALLRL